MSMRSISTHATDGLPAVAGLCATDVLALLAPAPPCCDPSQRAGRALHGRHVALVASNDHDPSAEVFVHAATALGARVARIAPAGLDQPESVDAAMAAAMLGRLYAAIGCAGVHACSVSLLKKASGVPVLNDLSADTHASRLLADLMTLRQTLIETGSRGAVRPRLGICGPARSGLLRAWTRLGRAAEIDVIHLPASAVHRDAKRCDFVCRPGTPPELLVPVEGSHEAAGLASLAERQKGNHSRVIQVLLGNLVAVRH